MRAFKLVIPTALLAAGFFVCTTASYGTPEYTKKEKKNCTFCHSKVAPKDKVLMKDEKNLTGAGKYYAAHNHSFQGYTGK